MKKFLRFFVFLGVVLLLGAFSYGGYGYVKVQRSVSSISHKQVFVIETNETPKQFIKI